MSRAVIEGYAALFGVPDLGGDVIARGAFTRRGEKVVHVDPGRVKMLHQHSAEAPVGRWTQIEEDAHGLRIRGEVFTDTGLGRDLHRLLRGGALDGLSIGFKALKSVRTRTGRELREVELWEVSIVTFPMAPRARITSVGAETSEDHQGRPPRDLLG